LADRSNPNLLGQSQIERVGNTPLLRLDSVTR